MKNLYNEHDLDINLSLYKWNSDYLIFFCLQTLSLRLCFKKSSEKKIMKLFYHTVHTNFSQKLKALNPVILSQTKALCESCRLYCHMQITIIAHQTKLANQIKSQFHILIMLKVSRGFIHCMYQSSRLLLPNI